MQIGKWNTTAPTLFTKFYAIVYGNMVVVKNKMKSPHTKVSGTKYKPIKQWYIT